MLSLLPPELDENLGLAAFVDLDVDLWVLVALISEALEVAAVVEQVDGQAESQHAQHQQAHVHLNTTQRSVRHIQQVQMSKHLSLLLLLHSFMITSTYVCHLTHRGSPSRGPTMAMKRGCWSRAKRALIRDCIPVRLPNCEDGYLQGTKTCLTW